ncbi:hypothetical protein DFQ28_002904 [Apophysomyces sp. BC1034]|nr:hypothetical protein DFQ30_005299 [Apophysomyces sp. BC1015]KAG0179359.1 hypothetical protein DFQ29_002217 [Apophysomyces sp. BC1021]KAG0189774.1 hypothetical protein DFQ28_002904 [Apophysomyces sp. BC1034]
MPRPQSEIWQYFSVHDNSKGKGAKARCSYCGHEQACGITRLHRHLLRKCPNIPTNLRDELRQKEEGRSNAQLNIAMNAANAASNDLDNPFDCTIGSLQTSVHSYDQTSASQQQKEDMSHAVPLPARTATERPQAQAFLDWHLSRAMFAANIPFEAIENPLFVDFLKRLQPNYVPPKKSRLQQFLLKEQHWDLINWNDADPVSSIPEQQQQKQQPTISNRMNQGTLTNTQPITTDMEGAL